MKLEPLNLWLDATELNALAQRAVEARAELESLRVDACKEGLDLHASVRLPQRIPMLPDVLPVRARLQLAVREDELEIGLLELELQLNGMLNAMAKSLIDSQRGKLLDQLAERITPHVPVTRRGDSLLFSWRKLLQLRAPGLLVHQLALHLTSGGLAVQVRAEGDLSTLLSQVQRS